MRPLLLTGGAVRLVLLLTGLWVDNNSVVSYTDVDYRVFCDAAAAVAVGRSPVRACVERVERVPPALLLSRSGRGPLLPSVRPRHLPLHAAPGLGAAAHHLAECLVRTRPATGARAWWRGPPPTVLAASPFTASHERAAAGASSSSALATWSWPTSRRPCCVPAARQRPQHAWARL